MESVTLVNGNRQKYTLGLPRLVILGERYNDVAMAHIAENTGLHFTGAYNAETQPTDSNQIARLLMTYNFKTRYYNNGDHRNTLFLKGDHHVGFDVNAICYQCCVDNHIHTNGLVPGDKLAC